MKNRSKPIYRIRHAETDMHSNHHETAAPDTEERPITTWEFVRGAFAWLAKPALWAEALLGVIAFMAGFAAVVFVTDVLFDVAP